MHKPYIVKKRVHGLPFCLLVTEVWRHIVQNCYTFNKRVPHSDALFRGEPLNPRLWTLATKNLNDHCSVKWKPYVCPLNRFNSVHESDRQTQQTDGRTNGQNCDSNSGVVRRAIKLLHSSLITTPQQNSNASKVYKLINELNYYWITPPPSTGTGFCFRAISFFVSVLARLRENGWTDLHEIFREGVEWPWDDLITFWVNSGQRSTFNCYHRPQLRRLALTSQYNSLGGSRGRGLLCLAPQLVTELKSNVVRPVRRLHVHQRWLCPSMYR